jgi:hypothetical protein
MGLTTPRTRRAKQVPLRGRQKAGDTNGQGLTAFGGSWFALSAAGSQVSGSASNSGGGGTSY